MAVASGGGDKFSTSSAPPNSVEAAPAAAAPTPAAAPPAPAAAPADAPAAELVEDKPSSPAEQAPPKASATAATQPVPKAATRVAPSPVKAGLGGLGGGNKCAVCAKAVYAADPQFAADGKLFHKNCFKCLVCKSQLGLSSLAQIEGFCLCKPCYKTEFKMRGKVR